MHECSIVGRERVVARNHKRDTLEFFYYTSGAEHSNLICFNLLILFSSHSAYVL